MRRGAKPAKSKVEAKPPIPRKSRKGEGSRVQDLEKCLAEALDQQTAASEILRVISSSPTDVQPVFDAIVLNASRLCGGEYAIVIRYDGEMMHLAAQHNPRPGAAEPVARLFPRAPARGSSPGRAILNRSLVHIPDVLEDPEYDPDVVRAAGLRGVLSMPMLSDGKVIGAISVSRDTPGPFAQSQIELLHTFATQAVIAIENVRLFNETKDALERQTATSEILRVISTSPTDVQPVFEAIADSAMHLFDALGVAVVRYDGDLISMAAARGGAPGSAAAATDRFRAPHRPIAGFPPEQAVLTKTVHHVADVNTDPSCSDEFRRHASERGFRSVLSMPMLRGGDPAGVIVVSRAQPGAFSTAEVELLKTFADQAVIAIENVRLFTELQKKNRALTEAHGQVTEALEQQTATSEVLKVISRSAFDLQPVLESLIENAVRLCRADKGFIYREDGHLYRIAVSYGHSPEWVEVVKRNPIREDRGSATGRAVLERRAVHIRDIHADPEYRWAEDHRGEDEMHRTILAVPMLREGAVIGVIVIRRTQVEPFTDKQIELVTTFADQAVIAIENVRLFKELEARTGELTRSVEKLTALGEVSHALSSTLDVEAVLNTIVSRASQLAGAAGCSIYEYDEAAEQFELRATHNYDREFVKALQAAPLRKGEGLMGRAAEMREPVQIPDITQPGAYRSSLRDTLIRFGYRALLSVPLLLEDQIIGSLSFNRKAPGEFPPEVVEVLKTFATQSALAIQNARLFHEIADKSQQLEAASRHKSEFLANMSHELRTPLNAVIGFSEVLLQRMFGELNAKQDEYLKDIYASGQHLLSLINDILDLSKIEAGRMELAPAPFHLPTALENAITLVRERAARHGITLEIHLDPRLGDLVGDERKIKQVLLNLLSNAVKFTPEGGRISLKAGLRDGAVEISVSDTGIGIALEDQAAIFEEFRQVGHDETRKQEGTGLGLTLAKKFVELHGGRIWVESELDRGATFTFTLPVRPWLAS